MPIGGAQAAVTVLGWPGGPEETALRAVAEIYNGQEGLADENRVELLFFARDGFWDKLQADLAAGTTAFDLNLLATYSIGRYAPFMEPVTLSDEAEAVYGESVLSTMQFEGAQYGIPTDLSLHFMYYRQDLIDALLADPDAALAYGDISEQYLGMRLEPKAPDEWNWDDYAATALYFTQAVNPDSPTRYGTVLQMQNLLFNMMVWQSTARSYGGNWMDDEGNVTVDSDAYRRGLELYKLLYDAGTTPQDSTSYEFPEANAAFSSGQVATMLQWNGAAAELSNPETASRRLRAMRAGSPISTAWASGSTRMRPTRKGRRPSSNGSRPNRRRSPMPPPAARPRSRPTWSPRSPTSGPIWCSSASSPASTAM
jgi:multiple sugar transport system substrate-binding protein